MAMDTGFCVASINLTAVTFGGMENKSKRESFDPYERSASLSIRFFPFRELTPYRPHMCHLL